MEHLLVHQGYLALVGSSWETIPHDFFIVGCVIVVVVFLMVVSLRATRACSLRTEALRGEES